MWKGKVLLFISKLNGTLWEVLRNMSHYIKSYWFSMGEISKSWENNKNLDSYNQVVSSSCFTSKEVKNGKKK